MDEDRVRDLINDIARQGEGIDVNASGADLRNSAMRTSTKDPSPSPLDRRGLTVLRPFGHAAAIAWLVGIAALVVATVVLVGVPSTKHSNSQADSTTTTPRKPTSTTGPRTTPTGQSASQGALSRAVAATDATGNFD